MDGKKISVLLHDIRSTHNVGSMFRTADAVGVVRVYCSGYTPLPLDRFGRPVKEIAKTALGAERDIPWEHVGDPAAFLIAQKSDGALVVGIEQDERSVPSGSIKARGHTIVLVGSEVEGMPKKLRDLCDHIVEIPMHGRKESLNVSVAFGVGLYDLVR